MRTTIQANLGISLLLLPITMHRDIVLDCNPVSMLHFILSLRDSLLRTVRHFGRRLIRVADCGAWFSAGRGRRGYLFAVESEPVPEVGARGGCSAAGLRERRAGPDRRQGERKGHEG